MRKRTLLFSICLVVVLGIITIYTYMGMQGYHFSAKAAITNMPKDVEIIYEQALEDVYLQVGKKEGVYFVNFSKKKGLFYQEIDLDKQVDSFTKPEDPELRSEIAVKQFVYDGAYYSFAFKEVTQMSAVTNNYTMFAIEHEVMPLIEKGVFLSIIDTEKEGVRNEETYFVIAKNDSQEIAYVGILAPLSDNSFQDLPPFLVDPYTVELPSFSGRSGLDLRAMSSIETADDTLNLDEGAGYTIPYTDGDAILTKPLSSIESLNLSPDYILKFSEKRSWLMETDVANELWLVERDDDYIEVYEFLPMEGMESRYSMRYIYKVHFNELIERLKSGF